MKRDDPYTFAASEPHASTEVLDAALDVYSWMRELRPHAKENR